MYAASRGDPVTVSRLLDANANTHLRDITGKSALRYAAKSGNVKCLRMLLATAIDINRQDDSGFTVLHYITYSKNHDRDAIDCVLAAGADVHVRNLQGNSPLEFCGFWDDSYSAKALLKAGANIDTKDCEGDTPLCEAFYFHADNVLQTLLRHKATYTSNDSHGNSILHQAALYGGLRTLEILLHSDLKALDPDTINREGKTSRQLVEERVGREAGFMERMDQLLAQVRLQNAKLKDSRQVRIQDRDFPAEALRKETPGSSGYHSRWATITGMKGNIGWYHITSY